MSFVAIAIVIAGLGVAAALAIAVGLDSTGTIILTLILVTGFLAIAVVRKSGEGVVGPAQCPECGGLLSPNAPYCKHCGAQISERS
jgi:hypothetical protein